MTHLMTHDHGWPDLRPSPAMIAPVPAMAGPMIDPGVGFPVGG